MNIHLVNLPFAAVDAPSLALTQLRSVARDRLGDDLPVAIDYLNQDCALHLELRTYREISESVYHHVSGVGEWLFRQVAFPELEDNEDAYFRRFYWQKDADTAAFRSALSARRASLENLLRGLIVKYGLDRADVVGMTSMFSQTVACLALARLIREVNPGVVMMLGGANCEWPMAGVLAAHARDIDLVFSGPALRSFPEVLDRLRRGDLAACGEVPGVHPGRRLDPRGEAVKPSGEVLGEELDIDVPVALDYTDFLAGLAERLGAEVEPTLFFETSRGCWWGEKSHCTFCGLNGQFMNYRAKSPEHALDQFRRLFEQAPGCRKFASVDNIIPKTYYATVFPSLNPPPGTELFYELKLPISRDELRTLVTAGVTTLQPGIEALDTSLLQLMRKGTTAHQNLHFLKDCVAVGAVPEWNLLVGFPHQAESVYERYAALIPKVVHLPPPNGIFPIRFDRFSPYHAEAAAFGLDLAPLDFYELIYPYPAEALADLAYYFADQNLGEYFEAMAGRLPGLQAQVADWRARWHGADRPVLELRGDRVVDTRGPEPVVSALDASTAALLRLLARPRREQDLPPGSDLTALLEAGWIFEEGGRFSSLLVSEGNDGDEAGEPASRFAMAERLDVVPAGG